MNQENEPLLSGHDADGITELDNNLPRWWVWLFVLCCVWALGYLVYFHVMGGPGQLETYRAEMAAAGKPLPEVAAASGAPAPAQPPPPPAAVPAIPEEASKDEKIIAQGREIFGRNCMVCHGPDGGGLIGPNMTDDYFIHGPKFADSVNVIIHGVPAMGMVPWQGVLKPEEIYAVASFVYTLRGTTPATPKPPQGEKASL